MLAIIIPYFKIEFFEETLHSLAKQTNKNFHVYIGDDDSPEDPQLLIKKYRDTISLSYTKFEKNLGKSSLTAQWERCIRLSRDEEWLMILGDDDFISDNYFEEFYKYLEDVKSRNIRVVRFASRIVRGNGEISKLYTHPIIENASDFLYRKFFKGSRGSLTEQIFCRGAYEMYGFRNFPLGWGADNFAWLEFSEFGEIFCINTATAYFRISDQNISRGGYKEEIKAQAKFQYFTILVEQYLNHFSSRQRIKILSLYELISLRAGKTSFTFWLKIISIYHKEKQYIEILRLIRRIVYIYPKRKICLPGNAN